MTDAKKPKNIFVEDIFKQISVWYLPCNNRIFLFHEASIFNMPMIEREDGLKLITRPEFENDKVKEKEQKLIYIGKL